MSFMSEVGGANPRSSKFFCLLLSRRHLRQDERDFHQPEFARDQVLLGKICKGEAAKR